MFYASVPASEDWGSGGCWNDYPCTCDTMYHICEGVSEGRPQDD